MKKLLLIFLSASLIVGLCACNKGTQAENSSPEQKTAVTDKKTGEVSKTVLPCDTLVTAVGYKSNNSLYESLKAAGAAVYQIGDAKEVTLQSPIGLAENSAYIIRSSDTETFIFENRQPSTWYPKGMGSGVMVSRIAYDQEQWAINTLNNIQSAKRALMLTANNVTMDFGTNASLKNLYGNGVNSIQSMKTLSEEDQAVNISNIVKNDDGTITLTIDTTTGISTIRQNSESSTMYYTLQGCCAGNDYQQLHRGLYIVNGQKVVKK